MSEFNTGGPAFPNKLKNTNYEDLSGFEGEKIPPGFTNTYSGMTLRDYFAAKAMQGYLSSGQEFDEDGLSEYAYRQADSMLKARDAKHG